MMMVIDHHHHECKILSAKLGIMVMGFHFLLIQGENLVFNDRQQIEGRRLV